MTRVLLDQGISRSAVVALRVAAWDATHVHEFGYSKHSDASIIELARREKNDGFVLVMVAYYEGPTVHPPANLLPAMAAALGVGVDTLLGVEASRRRARASDTRRE